MVKDDYKLVPTSEFDKITYELEKLRENSFGSKTHTKEVQVSIQTLNKSISDLLDVFKQAHHEMTEEERESRVIKKEMQPFMEQFQKVEDNQEVIANGIVVVSDSVAKLSHKINDLHKKFDDVFTRLDRIERAVKQPDVTKTTRRQFTTRQYQSGPDGQMMPTNSYQSPLMQSQDGSGMSPVNSFAMDNPSPFGGDPMQNSFNAMDIPPMPGGTNPYGPVGSQSTSVNIQKNELQKKSGLFGK
jgi:hypothetical protein